MCRRKFVVSLFHAFLNVITLITDLLFFGLFHFLSHEVVGSAILCYFLGATVLCLLQ